MKKIARFVHIIVLLLLVSCEGVETEAEATLPVVNSTAEATEIPSLTPIIAATETAEPTPTNTLAPTRDPALPTPISGEFFGLVETARGPMFIQCSGPEGGLTIILEAGLGENSTGWRLVQNEVEESARVCGYNRLTGPLPDGTERTARSGAEELHLLLETTGIPGPYVLVGHSYGGFVIRLYTEMYPDEVVGLVFVDSSHPDQRQRMNDVMLPEEQEENQSRVRPSVGGIDFDASALQVAETGDFGDRPVMVLTQGKWQTGLSFISAETEERMYQEWIAMHDEIAALSSNSEHRFAPESGHHIQRDEPEIVVEGILWVLGEIE